jgi:hypothetical protein
VNELLLLVAARFRVSLRWAKSNIYTWLFLGPLAGIGTYLIARRVAENLGGWNAQPGLAVSLSTIGVACLIGLSLSRTVAEVYNVRRPEAFFESLPVSSAAFFHSALLARLLRTAAVAVSVHVARWALGGGDLTSFADIPSLVVFALLLANIELLAALSWVHWSRTRRRSVVLGSVVPAASGCLVAGLLVAIAIKPKPPLIEARPLIFLIGAGGALVLYAINASLHARWRTADIETARTLNAGPRRRFAGLRLFDQLSPPVAAQLNRDLRLTLRRFSSAVYGVPIVAALGLALLPSMVTSHFLPRLSDSSGWFETTWLPPVLATKVACTAVCIALSALTPALVRYQLDYLWLERAVGTTGLEVCQAKLWYTRIVTAPAPICSWLLGIAVAGVPLFYALPLLAECIWLWWLLSSVLGLLAFEMPQRPGVATLYMATLGGAIGLISALLWPLGLLIYVHAMESAADRGRHRARYYLLGIEE